MNFRTLSAAPRLRVAVAVSVVLTLLASSDGAQGSFPGANGKFVLSWSYETDVGIGTIELATLNSDGSNFNVIAACGYECYLTDGDWSPSGRRIVYAADWDSASGIVSVRPNGTDSRVIHLFDGAGGLFESPAWSPDGRRVAFIKRRYSAKVGDWVSNIYIVNRDGTGLRRLVSSRKDEFSLDWSSRGRIAFTRGESTKAEIFTIGPNGFGLRRLTNNAVYDGVGDWSPDGTRLTFSHGGAFGGEVWRMGVRGGNQTMIASGGSPTWAPDGSVIAYVAPDGAIHTVTPAGQDDTVIGDPVSEGGIGWLDWQPR